MIKILALNFSGADLAPTPQLWPKFVYVKQAQKSGNRAPPLLKIPGFLSKQSINLTVKYMSKVHMQEAVNCGNSCQVVYIQNANTLLELKHLLMKELGLQM